MWKWRISEASNSLWYTMLRARYGDVKLRVIIEGGRRDMYSSKSVGWAGVISSKKRPPVIFFVNNCFFRIGDGYTTFWHAHWMGEGIIKNLFSPLFEIYFLQDVSIAGMGGWLDGVWRWNDLGIHVLPGSDVVTAGALLLGLLQQNQLLGACGMRDNMLWRPSGDKIFCSLLFCVHL